ncbi:MAG: L-fucose/L-arabinose isomerase family protein [Acidimicrobiales bacterium]
MTTRRRPKIGLLGVMHQLYDDMIPGITDHQASYARELASSLSQAADVVFTRPARDRADVEAVVRELNAARVDGIMVVMLTYGPAMRTVRALLENPLPVLVANVQPEGAVTDHWDMADLTYNQGIHGAQDQANALLRSGVAYSVITDDWRSVSFRARFESWARAAMTASSLRRAKIALFGYPMNGMGDILYDAPSMLRRIGPMVVNESLGEFHRKIQNVTEVDVKELVDVHHQRFAVSPELPGESHAYAVRMELALRSMLEAGGYEGFAIHFEPVGNDGRFRQLPLLAASDLMAEGYGYGAEGDTNAASLLCAGHLLAGDAHFSEMYAMDFSMGSVLISHMGEGNWKVARSDRPVKLIDRPLGIGGLGNPPTAVFSAEPGPATTAALVPLEGDNYRLVVGKGEVLDTPELPQVEMPYFHFRPASGLNNFMERWLRNGGTHHFCTNLGDHVQRWRYLAEMLEIDFVEI